MNYSLKKNIYERYAFQSFNSNYDRLIASSILYKYIEAILATDSSESTSTISLVNSYSSNFSSEIDSYKHKYISYNQIIKLIDKNKIYNFMNFSDKLINGIYELYKTKIEIVPFSTTTFDKKMYKISSASIKNNDRLNQIHFNIMVPIIKYYSVNNKTPISSLEIEDAEIVQDNPGKTIKFLINGIESSKVISDLRLNRFGNSKYIYTDLISLENDYIIITTKI